MEKNLLYLLLIWALLFNACSRNSEKDLSLTPEKFEQMGIPDPTQPWTYNDYLVACRLLDNLRVFQPYALPKKNSKRSGIYFQRIIHPENFSFVLDETLTLNERAYEIQKYVDIQALLITMYTDLGHPEQYYHRELIDLYIFGLTISQNMLDLGQQINESVDEEDIELQHAYNSIQEVYVKMVLFVLENQKKENLFDVEDLERITEYVSGSVNLNNHWMLPSAKIDIKNGIQEVLDNTSSTHIRNIYEILIKEL